MALGSLKGKPGITFLMPQDKAFLTKLEKLAYSDKTEEATKAGDMINALIIRDVFKTPADWKAKEVINSLMPSQLVEVESTSTTEVVFKSGAKAVIDKGFNDASRKKNLAVWKLISGEIPVTTDKPAPHRSMKPKGKLGSYDPVSVIEQNERYKIALAVENSYALSRLQYESSTARAPYRDVYLETTLSLINYIYVKRNDLALLYERVLPIISLDKMDFYFLVEPHKFSGSYLLDDALIHEWWVNKHMIPCNARAILDDIEHLLTNNTSSSALVYSDRASILAKIDSVRLAICARIESKPRECVADIESYYKELENNNQINGLGPIYPPTLAQYYKESPGLKLVQDELRFLAFGAFCRLETEGFDIGNFHELVNMIGECLYVPDAKASERRHVLLDKNTIKYLISPGETISEIKIFVNSTMLLYIPLTRAEANTLKVKNSVKRPDPNHIAVFNIAKNLYLQHDRLIGTNSATTPDIIAALKSLDVATLDPAVRAEILKKFNV